MGVQTGGIVFSRSGASFTHSGWLARYRQAGPAGLAVRARHPAWGGRKIRHWLLREGVGAAAASTATAILA